MCVAVWTRNVPRGFDCSAGDIIRLLEVGKNLRGALVIGSADFGQADLSRRAVEQPRPEPLFQSLDVIAHHGGRHVELAPRSRKPAVVDDPDEGAEAGQPVHLCLRLSSIAG